MMASGQEGSLRTTLPRGLVLEGTLLVATTLALCAAAGSSSATSSPAPSPAAESRALSAVYLDGEAARLDIPESPKPATIGPWRLGTRVSDTKPRDKRLNLYIVAPGTQYHLESADDFDHNAIINALPEPGKSREYDVYWALVLDPHLHTDFRNERDLLIAAQASFTPNDLFEFDDIPADTFLRTLLKLDSLDDLGRYRHKNGTLPRVIIVPAGFAITASAPPADANPAPSSTPTH